MGVNNPYTPPVYPALSPDGEVPPEVQAQLDYARSLDSAPQPMAGPEQASPNIPLPFTNRVIPGTAIDRASPALLAALRSFQPATRGKGRDVKNALSLAGQVFLGSRIEGAKDRAQAHAEDLALAKEQRGYQQTDRRAAHAEAARTLAYAMHEKRRAMQGTKATKEMVDAAPELGLQVGDIVPANALGTIMQRLSPAKADARDPMLDITTPEMQSYIKSTGLRFAPGTKMVPQSQLRLAPETKPDPSQMMDPNDVRVLAHQYVASGGLITPSFGMGAKNPMRQQFYTAVAQELRSGAADLPTTRSAVKGLTTSFANMRKQYDNTTAFENTALKNADITIATLGNLADTGSPILNQPLRSLQKNVFGDKNVVAYETARRVVTPEFARLLQSANANGVLSDNARHEVESILGSNPTVGQALQALKILKEDAANRKASYQGQLSEIQGSFAQLGLSPTGSRFQTDPGFPMKLESKATSIALGSDPKAIARGLSAVKAEADSAGISDVDWQAMMARIKQKLPKK